MKLTCPECFSEFTVPDAQIGPSGRRVRCNVCTRIWFQEPDYTPTNSDVPAEKTSQSQEYLVDAPAKMDARDDAQTADGTTAQGAEPQDDNVKSFTRFDDGMDFDPIPPSLHPAEEDEISHSPTRKFTINKHYALRMAMGFFVASAVFALLLWVGALVGLHKGALRGFYKPFGIVHAVAPLSLSVENANADIFEGEDGALKTKITATLRNTGNELAYIPLIEMSIITASGAHSDSVYIKPETLNLTPDQTLDIEATLPTAITEGESIRIRFIGD